MDTPNGSPGSGLLEIGPFGAQLKIRKSCSTIAQAGLSLVHSRALILKDCIAFLWSCFEHTASGPLCIYTNQPCYCPSDSPKASAIVLFQEPACWPFSDCQLKTKIWWWCYFCDEKLVCSSLQVSWAHLWRGFSKIPSEECFLRSPDWWISNK